MVTVSQSHSRGDSVARNRWLVHVSLIIGFLGAALSPIFLSRRYLGHSGTTDHAIISVIVMVLVLGHLYQRRRTVKRLLARLGGRRESTGRRSLQAQSDLVLWILTLNAMASGVADYLAGHPIYLSIHGVVILQKWHAVSVLALLVYVIVHVVRRRKRLRISHIS